MAVDDELARRRHQLEDLEQLITVGFWSFDVASQAVEWSPGLHRLFGTDLATFTPTFGTFLDLVHPDDRDLVNGTIGRALEQLEAYGLDHRFRRASDGALRWTRCHGRVDREPDGRARAISGVSIDVTEEHLASEGFRELIANAAHELRTPAAAIAQAVHALEGDLSEAHRAQVHEILARQASRLRRLTADLVDFGQIDGGPSAAMRQPVDVGGAVRAALELAPPPEGRTVVLDGLDEGVAASAEAAALERVLVNLLTNAWRYGGTIVSVTARRDGRRVVIEVADNGEGIPEEAQGALFEPFRPGPRRHPEASGLGLAIVAGLARHMGGSVVYRAGTPGAVFAVTLDAVTP